MQQHLSQNVCNSQVHGYMTKFLQWYTPEEMLHLLKCAFFAATVIILIEDYHSFKAFKYCFHNSLAYSRNKNTKGSALLSTDHHRSQCSSWSRKPRRLWRNRGSPHNPVGRTSLICFSWDCGKKCNSEQGPQVATATPQMALNDCQYRY